MHMPREKLPCALDAARADFVCRMEQRGSARPAADCGGVPAAIAARNLLLDAGMARSVSVAHAKTRDDAGQRFEIEIQTPKKALLMIDLINPLDFPAGPSHHRRLGGQAAALLEALPTDPRHDHFVAKSQHSGFFETELQTRLRLLHVDHLSLTGVAADICVLATAFDAHMRRFDLSVPCDCVASESADAEFWAVWQMARLFGADVRPSTMLYLPVPRVGGVPRRNPR